VTVDLLVAEIGSTTTVVSAFRLNDRPVGLMGQASQPTSVEQGDVTLGLEAALRDLGSRLGRADLRWNEFMVCSSAAGGLRMTVHGLVHDMTARAAQEAALGAGAIVKMVTAGRLQDDDLEEIKCIKPNIILLAGGVDYGERETVVFNARRLASLAPSIPVIYAGNITARRAVREALGWQVNMVENVYPRIDQLNVEPTREAIQAVFERHITVAPGMSRIHRMVTGRLMPTPGAVLEAAALLYEEIGDLTVFDVGGSTTDVHSVTEGSPEVAELSVAPEPQAKRTVEGDLGVFRSAPNLVRRIGKETLLLRHGLDADEMLSGLSEIPRTGERRRFVNLLAREAVRVALARHAGRIESSYGPGGRKPVARGRDLTAVRWLVGTGGVLTRLGEGKDILEGAIAAADPRLLYPRAARVLIDTDYIMAAAGVMARSHPGAALKILLSSLNAETGARPGPDRDRPIAIPVPGSTGLAGGPRLLGEGPQPPPDRPQHRPGQEPG